MKVIERFNHFKGLWLYYIMWFLLFPIVRLVVKTKGLKNLPKENSVIFVANHNSLLDPYIFSAILPLRFFVHWVAKKSLRSVETYSKEIKKSSLLWKLFLGFTLIFVHKTGSIFAGNGKDSVIFETLDALKTGNNSLGIFPTGTRESKKPNKKPRKTFVEIAILAKVKIVPVTIKQGSLRKRKKWEIIIHPPIRVGRVNQKDKEEIKNFVSNIWKKINN